MTYTSGGMTLEFKDINFPDKCIVTLTNLDNKSYEMNSDEFLQTVELLITAAKAIGVLDALVEAVSSGE
jgi:hypothetical protein